MTRPYRFLSTVVAESPGQKVSQGSEEFLLILAALICALVCIVGLIAVAYSTWLQLRLLANRAPAQPSAANKGIAKKFVEAIPKFTYDSTKEEKGRDCVICLVEYADGDVIRVLPQCGHGFHIGCIDKWLDSHSSCPSCRQIVVISKCKTCGEVPAIAAGKISLMVEHEGRQHNGGSCSINNVQGSQLVSNGQ